jgi:hypothetical protein
VGVAIIPTWYAFELTRSNPAKKSTDFAQSSSRWQDLREQALNLRDAVIALKPDERVPEGLMRQILNLNSKITHIEDAEPKDNPQWIKDALNKAYEDEIVATYGVGSEELSAWKEAHPFEWAKHRYGFVPDQATLARIIGKPIKNALVPGGPYAEVSKH